MYFRPVTSSECNLAFGNGKLYTGLFWMFGFQKTINGDASVPTAT